MKNLIHPTAIINPSAKLGANVEVGPYAIIDGDVELGDGCKVMAHAYIHRYTKAGKNCVFWPGSSIGAEPQDLKFAGEITHTEIGDNCVFRECCTVHRGTKDGCSLTKIGNNVLMMAYTHCAHDCQVGDHVIMSNNATLAGHVVVEDRAIIGGLAAVHQFTRIGRNAMIGGMARITQDIPPYMIAAGDPAFVSGLNTIGLERAGFDEAKRLSLKKAFRILYHQKNRMEVAIEKIDKEIIHNDATEHLLEFLREELDGGRGILRTRRG